MHRLFGIRIPAALVAVFLAFLLSSSFCQKPVMDGSRVYEYPVHLVIDAGSSGTRFCPFYMHPSRCELVFPEQDCFSVESRSGLADLSEEEVQKVMGAGFQKLDGLQIQEAVLLGTGGFRKLPSSRQAQQIQMVKNALSAQFAVSQARVISGEEEARLAYMAVAAYRGGADHMILETGGATVQLAGRGRKPSSIPAGLNALRSLSGPPEPCRPDASPSTDRFDECVMGLNNVILDQPWYDDFFQKVDSDLPVYVLGSSWKSIFGISGTETLDFRELRDQGRRICNSSLQDVVAEGVPEKFAPDSCYLHSYQFLFLWSLRISEVRRARGSWPPGAAVSEHFKACESNHPG